MTECIETIYYLFEINSLQRCTVFFLIYANKNVKKIAYLRIFSYLCAKNHAEDKNNISAGIDALEQ